MSTARHFQQSLAQHVFLVLLLGLLLPCNGNVYAQEAAMQISSREAWVGSPIVLQVQIRNAKKYSLPEDFNIDGCDVRRAGNPSQSSQITIINGRRSENRTVTVQYLITPRREGQFKIPALEIEIDGETKKTQPTEFVATQSETGNLLFVEIEGKKDAVFVGEPLDLKLKIWIKPFGDQKNKLKLTEAHMWQMLSNESSWGAFRERLQEMTNNRQRPRGEAVLREDDDGNRREYYLYEIEGTIYPTKPGKIDASDLQIVVNYPLSLGVRRDPFSSFFGGSPFGSSSFGNRLAITDSRPVTAKAEVNSTEVLPIPSTNQPADYRGAVGRYTIAAEVGSTNVAAGDPITLRLGIEGDGPMELVQAPPLQDIESLTNDFLVSDQSLAGFVQDDTKFFITTIRPRSESVKQIPAIPFSFFDPNNKTYQTVYTRPIDIEVAEAESLLLDSIVSNSTTNNEPASSNSQPSTSDTTSDLNFSNSFSDDILQQENATARNGWLYFAIVPACCWLMLVVGKLALAMPRVASRFKSPMNRTVNAINSADSGEALAAAMRDFVTTLSRTDCRTNEHAVGQLRSYGDYPTANLLESWFHRLGQIDRPTAALNDAHTDLSIESLKRDSHLLLADIQQACTRRKPVSNSQPRSRRRDLTTTLIMLALCGLSLNQANAGELHPLSPLLVEANESYQAAREVANSDPVKARSQFRAAAERYQRLVDQGIRNSELFFNLGNAWHQSGDATKAIVNYHRALWLNPAMAKARRNLQNIKQQKSATNTPPSEAIKPPLFSIEGLKSNLLVGADWVGWNTMVAVFAVASILFWGLACMKTVKRKFPAIRWAVIPLILMCICGLGLYWTQTGDSDLAIVTTDVIELRSGDGNEFPIKATLESSAGTAVKIKAERQSWLQIELPNGKSGWTPEKSLDRVAL